MRAAVALCGLGALALSQSGVASDPKRELLSRARLDEHRAVLQGERTLQFLERLAHADKAAAAAILERLESARPSGASAHWSPSLDLLRRAEGVIDPAVDGADPAWESLDRLAGALDLVVVPGAFEIVDGAMTEPITVHVSRAWGADAFESELTLEWVDAAGQRTQARREPVAAAAIGPRAFQMYLRAPATSSGRCFLIGQLARRPSGRFAARLPAVRVDAIENLRERLDALRARDRVEQPGYRRLEELLSRLLVAGLRGSTALGGGDMLLALERWTPAGPPRGLLVPLELSYQDERGSEHWLWSYSPEREPERAIAFLAHSAETAEQVLAGELGAAWMDFAERTGTQLFATRLPRAPAQAALGLQRLREWTGALELIVIARGDALAALSPSANGDAVPTCDAWVALTSIPAASCDVVRSKRPGLLIAPGPAPSVPSSDPLSATPRVDALALRRAVRSQLTSSRARSLDWMRPLALAVAVEALLQQSASAQADVEWVEGPRLWFVGEPGLRARVEGWLERRAQSR